MLVFEILRVLMAIAVVVGAQTEPATTPSPQGAVRPGEGEFSTADDLLNALEQADASLRTFQAELVYDRRFALQGDQQVRHGSIYYRVTKEKMGSTGDTGVTFEVPRRTFAVHFTTLTIDGAARPEELSYVFDGQWFIERNTQNKRFVKRQVALPGEVTDPLKLGEGPFPIPIGQKRVDILARYTASLASRTEKIEDEPELNGPLTEGCTQLVLVARPDAGNEGLREIRLWYRRDPASGGVLLPRLARSINTQGDESYVWLVGMRVNSPSFPAERVSIDEPAEIDGWDVQVEYKRGVTPDDAVEPTPAPVPDR